MTQMVGRLLGVLFDASLAATAIAGLVVLVMVHCRQPARRLGWARAGLLASVALIPLATLGPIPPIDLGRWIRMVVPDRWDEPGPAHIRPGPRDAYLPEPDQPCPPEPGNRHLGISPGVARGLLLAYGLGLSFGLGRVILGLWGMAILARRGRAPSARTLAIYRSLPTGSLRSLPRLAISDRMTRPVLAGLFRPIILLPTGSERPGGEQGLRLSLLHELAHAESGDHLVMPLANLIQSIWFFLPPIWWIRDQMKMDQEFLADRRAVAHFGSSGGYASSLVDLAGSRIPEVSGGGEARPGAEPGASRASALFQRVSMLLKCPFAIENHPPLWWRRSAAATITLATLAASCLSFRGLAPTSPAGEPAMIRPARTFKIPDLVITPSAPDQAFDLRFRLPAEFDLKLDIMADPLDLPSVQILHHSLSNMNDIGVTNTVYRLWHDVRIRRQRGRDLVEVDGRPIVENDDKAKPAIWLTIRPIPGRPTRIRDLIITW